MASQIASACPVADHLAGSGCSVRPVVENGHVGFIWSIADLLRGDYKQSEYGRVILPLVVIRRLDLVLEPTKAPVVAAYERHGDKPLLLQKAAGGLPFWNTSKLTFTAILGDADNVAKNLVAYINAFSENALEIIEKFKFFENITRLDDDGLLYLVLSELVKPELDLRPNHVSATQMGHIFEELIRRFSEQSNETAGEHFTPREVIELMVNLLFIADSETLSVRGKVRTLYDPACGTGGMLSVAENHLLDMNPDAHLEVFGQELNDESYAICQSDMLLKGQDPEHIAPGNTLTADAYPDSRFDYLISNPPFGVEWKKVEKEVKAEARDRGMDGRFGAGLPPIDDGSMLFLQHMVSKMRPKEEGGSRLAIVFNGSPLFAGAAGQNMNAIRTWLIEQDLLESVVALPDQLFYNTGIYTYIWVLSNHKLHPGTVHLIDAREMFEKMPRSLGNKRKRLGSKDIAEITRIYGDHDESSVSKVLINDDFGYWRITVERPLRQRYEVTPEAVETVRLSKSFIKLAAPPKNSKDPEGDVARGHATQARLIARLEQHLGLQSRDHNEIGATVDSILTEADGHRLGGRVRTDVMSAISIPDPSAPKVKDGKKDKPDADLREYESVPFSDDIDAYFQREVLPHAPEAWVDKTKTKIGYEIPFTRLFYVYREPRPLGELDAEIREIEKELLVLLKAFDD
jgi:type I restriction enzyme M protein